MTRFLITLLCLAPWLAQAQLESTSDLNRGLVGWWKFDTSTGTNAFDLSGNNNTGALSGSTLPVWTNGVFGGALEFDGSHAYIEITQSSSLNVGAGDLTISLWVKFGSVTGTHTLFTKRGQAAGSPYEPGFIVWENGAQLEILTVLSGGTAWKTEATTTAALTTGVWYHIAVVRNNNVLSLYLNGASKALSGAQASGDICNSYDAFVGVQASGIPNYNIKANFLSGFEDDVRIYSRALSATEVLNLYCQGGGRTP